MRVNKAKARFAGSRVEALAAFVVVSHKSLTNLICPDHKSCILAWHMDALSALYVMHRLAGNVLAFGQPPLPVVRFRGHLWPRATLDVLGHLASALCMLTVTHLLLSLD